MRHWREYLSVFGFLLGVIGCVVSFLSYQNVKLTSEIVRGVEIESYFNEIEDEYGFVADQSDSLALLFSENKMNNAKEVRDRLKKIRRLIEKIEILSPEDEDVRLLPYRFLYYAFYQDEDGMKRILNKMQSNYEELTDSRIYMLIGMIFSSDFNQSARANKFFTKAIEIDPDDVTFSIYGFFLHAHGENEKAIEMLGKAIARSPLDVNYQNALGHVLYESKHFERAEEVLIKALSLKQSDGRLHNTLANLYAHKGETEKAISEYKKAIDLSPNIEDFYLNLYICLHKSGHIHEANVLLEDAKRNYGIKLDDVNFDKIDQYLPVGIL